MHMTPATPEQLVALAQTWYPRFSCYGYEIEESPEKYRLKAHCKACFEDNALWKTWCAAWKERFPGGTHWDYTPPWHPACYFYRYYPPDIPLPPPDSAVIIALVSYLAPVYYVYASCETGTEGNYGYTIDDQPSGRALEYAEAMGQEIERIFDYRFLPYSICQTPVPDVLVEHCWEQGATLMDCLFTSSRW